MEPKKQYKRSYVSAKEGAVLPAPVLRAIQKLGSDLALARRRRREDSVFHFAFADTAPDGWGCKVIARDHAKRRKAAQQAGKAAIAAELNDMDFLLGVDDFSRIGALRLADPDSNEFLRVMEEGGRGTPPLLELAQLMAASRAVELNRETEADLRYLRGRGTSIGGMRPECSVIDDDGHLAIGKFPSVSDERCLTRGEVLALHLAAAAGITVAESRVVMSDDIPVALIRRFDRMAGDGRIPYLSAASMLQATRREDHAYTQIAEVIVANCVDPGADLEQLWRRLVFNLLITNVDDHVQNHGFLHVEPGQWPARRSAWPARTWMISRQPSSMRNCALPNNYSGTSSEDAMVILKRPLSPGSAR
ncbi:type II toxin-antitoxin system HipA family toxin [Oxalobacteraceae bacterium A2-2]